jgi:hypothetical protein
VLVETGGLLGGRYRLDRRSHTGAAGLELWRATDEILDRRVAVHLVGGLTKAQAKELTDAAVRAGGVPDARWVRVLDVGVDAEGAKSTARRQRVWIVNEWVDGQSLTSLIRRDPLKGPVATELLVTCAQAVDAANRAGARHSSLHPDEVLLTAEGTPRLTGLELHRALAAATESTHREYDDTRGLGGLLFALLTGRWPLPGWTGLPTVNRGDGFHPKQQRGSVSRELDEITARALQGGFDSAGALAKALAVLPTAPLIPPVEDHDEPRLVRSRRIAWWVIPPLLITALGIGAWVTGRDLGRVPGADRTAVTSAPPPKHGHAGNHLVWSTPPSVTSFDPDGDGTEDPGGVGLAVDNDPSTGWSTDIYHRNANFGGLKPGVGLLIDLGRAKQVTVARLLMSAAGADVQLRAGDAPPAEASDLPLVAASNNSAASSRIAVNRPTKARYWLLWITTLPRSGSDDYSVSVNEIDLLR